MIARRPGRRTRRMLYVVSEALRVCRRRGGRTPNGSKVAEGSGEEALQRSEEEMSRQSTANPVNEGAAAL